MDGPASRLTALTLTAAVFLSALVGCGGSKGSKSPAPPARGRASGFESLLSDHRARREPQLEKPEYKKPFRDPVFGTSITRITDASGWGLKYVVNEY